MGHSTFNSTHKPVSRTRKRSSPGYTSVLYDLSAKNTQLKPSLLAAKTNTIPGNYLKDNLITHCSVCTECIWSCTIALKENPDKTNFARGFKVKRWNANWADERRVSKSQATLFWETRKSNCCPSTAPSAPQPITDLPSSDTVLGLVIGLLSTAKPLQEPVNIPVRTYSYKKEFVLLEDLQQPSSAPSPPFYFPLSVFNAKVVFKTKGLVNDL